MKTLLAVVAILSSSLVFSKEFIIKFKNSDNLMAHSLESHSEIQKLTPIAEEVGAFAVIESSLSLEELQLLAMESDMIEYIEPNSNVYTIISDLPNPKDKLFPKQWGLESKKGFDINAKEAWQVTRGSRDFIIAVVDTGINYKHHDLKANMWVNEAEKNGVEGVDDDGNGVVDDIYGYNAFSNNGDPMDDHGHGTHCAGVIGAVHNEIGISGIMPQASIMAIKIFGSSGSTSEKAIVRGIEYAVKSGVKIMSNSWGGTRASQAIKDAVKKAEEAGILFVAAAGNGNAFGVGQDNDKRPSYPASYDFDNILSVGSIKSNGLLSSFSNFGKNSVDIFAPGSDVLSTYNRGWIDFFLFKDKYSSYRSISGTSMATPHVTGVAGLVLSVFPNMSATEIKEKILESADNKTDYFRKWSVSGGTLNAAKAVR